MNEVALSLANVTSLGFAILSRKRQERGGGVRGESQWPKQSGKQMIKLVWRKTNAFNKASELSLEFKIDLAFIHLWFLSLVSEFLGWKSVIFIDWNMSLFIKHCIR